MNGSRNSSPPSLLLNALPVGFDRRMVMRVGRLPYEGHEAFVSLRERLSGTHVVRRRGNQVEIVALKAELVPPGTIDNIPAGDVIDLVAQLLTEWLIDHFTQLGRRVFQRRRALIIVSDKAQDDLLVQVVPRGSSLPSWLGFRAAYRLQVRVERPEGTPQLMVAVDTLAHIQIDGLVADMLAKGIRIDGLYVVRDITSSDKRLVHGGRLTGRVSCVVGDRLTLEDHEEKWSSILAADAKLEPRIEVLAHVVASWLKRPGETSTILERLRSLASTVAVGSEKLRRVQALASYLQRQSVRLAPGLSAQFGNLLTSKRRLPQHEVIPKPSLIFDAGGRHVDRWNQRGLDQHGPYDRFQFNPKHLNIAVICQADLQGRVEPFIDQLLHGVANTKGGDVGFLRRFALERPYVRVFRSAGDSPANYRRAAVEAVEHITDQGKGWDLAIVQITQAMEQLEGDANPYLVTKAFFLTKGIAVQHVHFETIEQADQQRAYSLNNIGLACYAKLGGIPWLLPTDQKVAHELVIGLGSHHERTTRLGGSNRYVGITTVFSGDGRYLLESRTRSVPFDDYRTAMLDAVRAAVNQVRKDFAWADDDPVRLVFHVFKPVKNAEVEAVQGLVQELALPHAEYAFVHIADDHPFQVFDQTQNGAWAGRQVRKGVCAPPRGLMVKLSNSGALLCLKGSHELKQASDGHPEPLCLHLHRASSFTDLTYLVRQAFAFSCHSWRSFLPAPLPITILYSELVAYNLRLLSSVSGWSDDAIVGRIGRTRWFL